MNWQLASFAVLAIALGAGVHWYERGRPDARVVALVATLAAVAALGRIAFAALPNVKPTTDVVLIAGYALGGGPGFAVGAIAGLVSNFFFGQGPWTPWQMAAWGLTGIIGAGLAIPTRGRIGRWPLALACAGCGFAFAAVQDLGDWVNFSDHSIRQLEVYVGKGVGFDLIHAGGCVMFALLIGPALIAATGRFTARLTVRWLPLAGALIAVGATLAPGLRAPVPAQAAGTTPAAYLLAAERPDGGLGSAPGAGSDPLFSGWAALGLAAGGVDPAGVARGGASLLGYLERGARSLPDPGALERTILVAAAAGRPATSFGGQDLVAALRRDLRPDGSVARQVNLTAFAILALRGAGAAVPARTVAWLARQQDGDGGFSFATAGGASDVDDTGAVLEALGSRRSLATRAVRFIRAQQNPDGGFPATPGNDSNAQSTAFAVQGLVAAGVDPATARRRGRSPLDYLRGLIAADGHVRYSHSSDQTPVWVTAQALMALSGKALPLAAPARPVGVPRAARTAVRHAIAVPARRRTAPGHRHPRGRRARLSVAGVPGPHGAVMDRLAAAAGLLAAVACAPVGI